MKYIQMRKVLTQKPGMAATMQRLRQWALTPATEWRDCPRWAGTTSASGTPPTTGTTGASSACSRRAAPGGRCTPRRSAWPSCWNLLHLGSRPPHQLQPRADQPTSPAQALVDPHRLRFWKILLKLKPTIDTSLVKKIDTIQNCGIWPWSWLDRPGALVPWGRVPVARLSDGSWCNQGWTHF